MSIPLRSRLHGGSALIRPFLIAAALSLAVVARVAAQAPPDGGPDPSAVRVRIGPLWLNPSIDMTNLGVDTNVFNDPPDQNPKQDFTLTVVPKTQFWMRFGPSWVSGEVDEQVIWYQKYASERSANTTYALNWKIPISRLTVDVGGRYVNTRDRPGYEIDARAQRFETTFTGKVEIRALSKTFFGVEASRQSVEYAADATFLDTSLHDELNRVVTNEGLTIRQQVTPLTSVTLALVREEDRFDFTPLRNSNSTSGTITVTFDPQALIKGTATFGYQSFQPVDPNLPSYTGATASADLSYVLLGMTKFGLRVTRGVQYSYDVTQPYYLQTGVSGTVAQQIFGPVDVVVRGGFDHLAYRDRVGSDVAVPDRLDTVGTYGAGVGYHVGRGLRIGVNFDNSTRSSAVAERQYSGRVFGTSVTYGF